MRNNKKLILRIAAAAVTISSIYIFAPWQFALYYLSPLPDTVQAELDKATSHGIDGIILYAQRKGKAPIFYASGWHDRQKQIPARPDALFKIGSIRKLYDAAALAKLVASGTLDPEQTLADLLPNLKGRIANAEQITLRMMVQHRSGIPNYSDQQGFHWGKSWTAEEALALVVDKPADFRPDSDRGYSNTNYLLLRRIMSDVLGYEHGTYIQSEILSPLALQKTYLSVKNAPIDMLMSGYHKGYEQDFKELDQGFVASAEDVGIFLRALNEGSFFTSEEQKAYASLYDYEHSGWVLGHSSRARFLKDSDMVVVQFTNTTGNDTVVLTGIVNNRILKILGKQSQP